MAAGLTEECQRLRNHIADLETRKRAPLYQKKQEEELKVRLWVVDWPCSGVQPTGLGEDCSARAQCLAIWPNAEAAGLLQTCGHLQLMGSGWYVTAGGGVVPCMGRWFSPSLL